MLMFRWRSLGGRYWYMKLSREVVFFSWYCWRRWDHDRGVCRFRQMCVKFSVLGSLYTLHMLVLNVSPTLTSQACYITVLKERTWFL